MRGAQIEEPERNGARGVPSVGRVPVDCSGGDRSNDVTAERDRNAAGDDTGRANFNAKRKPVGHDFFFHAEDGIRDPLVTGVQTCALPISHALSPSPRNLTDRQLDAIRESRGIAGLNFHVGFLREDGGRESNTPIARMVDHIEYMAKRMGIDHVALGSDFDGATMPAELKDAAGLPRLMQALRDRGFGGEDLRKLAHGNWVRVLRETWGA